MTRMLLPVASVAIALASVAHGANATRVVHEPDAQIHLYPFDTSNCINQPIGSPIELKEGQCVPLSGAHGVKPKFRPEHRDWIDDINEARKYCKLELFRTNGCQESEKINHYSHHRSGALPQDLSRCLSGHHRNDGLPEGDAGPIDVLQSVRFVCGKVQDPELLYTSQVTHTFWSMDPTGNPHSSEVAATYVGTITPTAHHMARNIAMDTAKPTHVPRDGPKPNTDTKSVWMRHPWSDSMVCYLCYTKKRGDYSNVECVSGMKFPAKCGEQHFDEDGQPTTPYTTTTATFTAWFPTYTTTTTTKPYWRYGSGEAASAGAIDSGSDSESDFPPLDAELSQKKSWHSPVKFEHPFVPKTHLCADAEWEKRGRPESYIKIQHCHVCGDKDRKDSKWIGLPRPEVHTVFSTTYTSTAEYTHTRKHDQL